MVPFTISFLVSVEDVIRNINTLLVEDASPEDLIRELKRPEGQLPPVQDCLPVVHYGELKSIKNNANNVRLT